MSLDPSGEEELCVEAAEIILLIAEAAEQGNLMDTRSLKCQSYTVSPCVPPGAGEVCELAGDKEGSRNCGRMLLLVL